MVRPKHSQEKCPDSNKTEKAAAIEDANNSNSNTVVVEDLHKYYNTTTTLPKHNLNRSAKV